MTGRSSVMGDPIDMQAITTEATDARLEASIRAGLVNEGVRLGFRKMARQKPAWA